MRNTTGWTRLISLGILLLASSVANSAGEMYRWVDENGQVHYSDQPPPANARSIKSLNSEGINPPPSADDEVDAEPSYAQQEKAFEERQAQRAEERAEAARKKQEEEERKKNCELARSNYNTVNSGGRVMRVNAQGEREYLNDEEIDKAAAEARSNVEKWCN
ncbi:MAG: DUF4124 domain-containing protein [Burkholderiales bacterium]|jgi:hypothetical protein